MIHYLVFNLIKKSGIDHSQILFKNSIETNQLDIGMLVWCSQIRQ